MTENKNIGQWLNEQYPEKAKFKAAIQRIVLDRTCSDPMPQLVHMVPNETMNECFLCLDQLDYTKDAKHGCYLSCMGPLKKI